MNTTTAPASLAVEGADAVRRFNRAVREANDVAFGNPHLAAPKPETIRAGRAGGLPFDTLTTDLMVGCLPIRTACFGTCFAANAAYKAGLDFGIKVPNLLDEDLFLADLALIPADQGYLRNGWNSDPSWDWIRALRLAQLVASTGRILIFISKCFNQPDAKTMVGLARAGAELRVSVSAFDTDAQLNQRLRTMLAYREAGGTTIPLVITTRFLDPALNRRQDDLVDHLLNLDFPAAENSLRVDLDAPVARFVDMDQMSPLADGSGIWCGRLYDGRLRMPTTTSVPIGYRGLPSAYLSRLDDGLLTGLFADPVPTHQQVRSGSPLSKPRQCGVPRSGMEAADSLAPGSFIP